MAEKTDSSANASDQNLVITRVFDAPRHLVYEMWTKKEHQQKWSAPHGFEIPYCDGDLRPGGKWACHMVAPDGVEHRVKGVYREIVPNELLVFTHGWEEGGKVEHESVVTVRFEDQGAKTRMTFEQGPFRSVESRDGHKGGWTQGFNKLGELLAKLQSSEKK